MPALYLLLPALCILAIAYRYYSAFIATRIWMLDDTRPTPAHTNDDGANYYPTTRWVEPRRAHLRYGRATAGDAAPHEPALAPESVDERNVLWMCHPTTSFSS